jgi:hypothetical protein
MGVRLHPICPISRRITHVRQLPPCARGIALACPSMKETRVHRQNVRCTARRSAPPHFVATRYRSLSLSGPMSKLHRHLRVVVARAFAVDAPSVCGQADDGEASLLVSVPPSVQGDEDVGPKLLKRALWTGPVNWSAQSDTAALATARGFPPQCDPLFIGESRSAQPGAILTAAKLRSSMFGTVQPQLGASSVAPLHTATDTLRAAIGRLKGARSEASSSSRSLNRPGVALARLADAKTLTCCNSTLECSTRARRSSPQRAGDVIEPRELIGSELQPSEYGAQDYCTDSAAGKPALINPSLLRCLGESVSAFERVACRCAQSTRYSLPRFPTTMSTSAPYSNRDSTAMLITRALVLGVCLSVVNPMLAAGQQRGAFYSTSAEDGARTGGSSRLLDLGKLLIDPSGRSPFRASPWGATLVAGQNSTEAQLQLNLSWNKNDAVALTLASPLNSDGTTDVATLTTLNGTPRLAMNFSGNVNPELHKLLTYSFEVTAGAPLLSYRTVVGGETLDQRKLNVSASANLKVQPKRFTKGFLRVGIGAEQIHKSRQAQSFCSPVAGQPPGTVSCSDEVVGALISQKSSFADVELRTLLPWGFGVGVRAINDINTSESRFEVPLWFILDEAGKLGGGVRLGYSTIDRRTTLTLFVSQFAP